MDAIIKQLVKYKNYRLYVNNSDDYKIVFNHEKQTINIINKEVEHEEK